MFNPANLKEITVKTYLDAARIAIQDAKNYEELYARLKGIALDMEPLKLKQGIGNQLRIAKLYLHKEAANYDGVLVSMGGLEIMLINRPSGEDGRYLVCVGIRTDKNDIEPVRSLSCPVTFRELTEILNTF